MGFAAGGRLLFPPLGVVLPNASERLDREPVVAALATEEEEEDQLVVGLEVAGSRKRMRMGAVAKEEVVRSRLLEAWLQVALKVVLINPQATKMGLQLLTASIEERAETIKFTMAVKRNADSFCTNPGFVDKKDTKMLRKRSYRVSILSTCLNLLLQQKTNM